MDSHTYGSSDAAETLVKLLEDNPDCKRAVGRHWSDYSDTIKEISEASTLRRNTAIHLGELFHKDMMTVLDECKLETDVRTYLKNVMVAKWRDTKKAL